MKRKPEYLRVYRWSQIENEYNDVPVMWCEKCLSLHILTLDSNINGVSEKYCEKCLSTDITVGHIFEWLDIQPVKRYKNLREYQDRQNRIIQANMKDAIAEEFGC